LRWCTYLTEFFDSPAKVLENGFDTVSHLLTIQTNSYTRVREVPPGSLAMKDLLFKEEETQSQNQ
jgi:hypothetical protein